MEKNPPPHLGQRSSKKDRVLPDYAVFLLSIRTTRLAVNLLNTKRPYPQVWPVPFAYGLTADGSFAILLLQGAAIGGKSEAHRGAISVSLFFCLGTLGISS